MTIERQTFPSVWDALADTEAQAANLRCRSELMSALSHEISSWNVSRTEAAARLHITEPRLSSLMKGHIVKFSLDALINLAAVAGLKIHLGIEKAA